MDADSEYIAMDPEHRKRQHTVYRDPEGAKRVPNGFAMVLPKVSVGHSSPRRQNLTALIFKNTQVSETQEFRRSFSQSASNGASLKSLGVEIFSYRGNKVNPEWMDVDNSQSLIKPLFEY